MIRLLIFTVLLSVSTIALKAQSNYPPGGYKDVEELRNRQPSIHSSFQPVFRRKEEILFIGGNDYFMQSLDESIDRKMIVKEIFAVSTGETLFINTTVHKLATGYANALSEGRYIAFRSGFKDKKKGRVLSAAMAFGPAGFTIAIPFTMIAALSKAKSAERHLIVIDTQTGIVSLYDRIFLLSILKLFSDIEYQYSIEQEQNSEEILITYLKMVNKAMDP